MSKLPKADQFLDLSDYGRPIAMTIAKIFKNTAVTPIHLTIAFFISGIIALICILEHEYVASFFFLITKSILDAADGELARIKNTPSYVGRYFDSIADFVLNFMLIFTIGHLEEIHWIYMLSAFIGLELQGTLYNYYYVILRNKYKGDTTSRIFEITAPVAMKGEKQTWVNFFFNTYLLLYGVFDKIVYWLDPKAPYSEKWPKWFMTAISTFGLGFQLLVIGLFLVLGWIRFVIPFFIGYSVLIFVFILVRKAINR
ncbi:CDP-alcohol phosphatidyltransferase family protein [Maribacter sp. TH_r10]|uniref:CDP-alcohol phosphatidyltransferase family protein n=1 Tax=Maribacter sp. TH_r10 TaxID=3082086 RepID=UPI002954601C|nr:CDP-alcohol phosphatidyltransferase family protein [Maribacter sp. TH_r10]MDV7138487.1 CDP-alcohol phosphatidyltransferase family protein [Maribacter sp. TH_r10]